MVGGGVIAAGELLLGPAREVVAPRALPPVARRVRIVPRASAPRPGCSARPLLAFDASCGDAATERAGPARRLPDADRQPRGRDAARAGRAARGRRGRLRGHAPHARAARPLRRRRRAACSYHEHNERARGARARRADARAARRSRSSATRACRSSATRASCSCRPCVAAGLAVEVLPGPSAALDGARRQRRCRPTTLALRRLPAAPRAELARGARGRRRRSSRSSRRGASRRRSRCSPSSTRSGRSRSAAS